MVAITALTAVQWNRHFSMNLPNQLKTETSGERISLVFLHYFGGSSKSWKFVIPYLEKDFNCLAIDMPGFGNTPPLSQPSLKNYSGFVREYLRKLSIQKYILIGHSMGGKIALQCVLDDQNQHTIEKLILIAPSPPSFEAIPKAKQKKMRLVPDRNESRKSVEADTVVKLSDERLEVAIQSPLEVDLKSRIWWINEGIHHSIAQESKQIKIPITIITSEDDPAITKQMTENETLTHLPSLIQLETVSHIGHLLPLEAPELTAQLIKKTLPLKPFHFNLS